MRLVFTALERALTNLSLTRNVCPILLIVELQFFNVKQQSINVTTIESTEDMIKEERGYLKHKWESTWKRKTTHRR